MPTEDMPSVSQRSHQDEPRRRPPELDVFVDHFLSTMCETSRRQILELLAQPQRDEHGTTLERRSTDIAKALGLSPSTTSEHLRQLTNYGLITYRREGTNTYYRIDNVFLVQAFHDLIAALDKEYASRMSRPIGEEVS